MVPMRTAQEIMEQEWDEYVPSAADISDEARRKAFENSAAVQDELNDEWLEYMMQNFEASSSHRAT